MKIIVIKKELYFDSLDEKEIKEWLYTKQIYFNYIYESNYSGKKYLDHYTQLINEIVGSTGYNDFVNRYMKKEKLEDNQLSNIIMKYDLKEEWDDDIGHNILKPKKYLKFISDEVEKYIVYKFYPPKNEEEYNNIFNFYSLIKDEYMRRMALKQIITYELSTGVK